MLFPNSNTFLQSVMFKFQKQRVQARKILLNRADIIAFESVPDHIVDAFYG